MTVSILSCWKVEILRLKYSQQNCRNPRDPENLSFQCYTLPAQEIRNKWLKKLWSKWDDLATQCYNFLGSIVII